MRDEIIKLRKKIIEREFAHLNDKQREAVLAVKGAVLVLAGAGSGKTTVLVNRIANILRWGEAYESDKLFGEYTESDMKDIQDAADGKVKLSDELVQKLAVSRPYPWRVLAITFTNRAASELKERICQTTGIIGNDVWAMTFHSACMRILRRYGERLGYGEHFTIYDTDDQKRVIRECIKALGIDEKMLSVKEVLPEISHAKDDLVSPEKLLKRAGDDFRLGSVAKIYKEYQKRLLDASAMDFDDIIYNTVELFNEFPDILEKYQEQFRYIMVDEYQDTNTAQYELVRLLSEKYGNVCVVGDDDQSIYQFRGATVENILEFDNDYENAKVVKLEQNYRSTKNILSAANSVIKNNTERHEKSLWTQNVTGNKIISYKASDEQDEGRFIANTIKSAVENGAKYSDYAILYRMNSQSQSLERAFLHAKVPYKIIGGRKFFEYREIRDMMAYLNIISNSNDNNRLKRIINIPKRGIGDRTISQIEEISISNHISMFEVMENVHQFDVLTKSAEKINGFVKMINDMKEMLSNGEKVSDMYEKLIKLTEYEPFIRMASDKGENAVENVHELTTNIIQYEKENGKDSSIQGFLEYTALLTDIDSYAEKEDAVVMMTIHSAKGLEFENVFLPGMEENIFPGFQAVMADGDMQEERRLAYVAITRAKKNLWLIHSDSRMLFGHSTRNRPSRFLSELPVDIVENKQREIVKNADPDIPEPRAIRRADIASSKVITSSFSNKPVMINYTAGMKVLHNTFGEGVIINVKPMASDCMLEIAFDSVGTKKLMGKIAKLTVLD